VKTSEVEPIPYAPGNEVKYNKDGKEHSGMIVDIEEDTFTILKIVNVDEDKIFYNDDQ